jgi:hypothetical protein
MKEIDRKRGARSRRFSRSDGAIRTVVARRRDPRILHRCRVCAGSFALSARVNRRNVDAAPRARDHDDSIDRPQRCGRDARRQPQRKTSQNHAQRAPRWPSARAHWPDFKQPREPRNPRSDIANAAPTANDTAAYGQQPSIAERRIHEIPRPPLYLFPVFLMFQQRP